MKLKYLLRFICLSLCLCFLPLEDSLASTTNKKTNAGGIKKKKKPATDLAENLDPQLQIGEDVSTFKKEKGEKPKNNMSSMVSGVKLKKPKLGGTGCAEGTVAASITPDAKTMSLLFDNYTTEAGGDTGIERDIKNCSVEIPIQVPAGYQFMVVKLDYRGFNSIPDGGRTRYVAMYSFFDEQTQKLIGRRVRRNYIFQGPLEEQYTISSDVTQKPNWSSCGRNTLFRIDTRAIAVTNDEKEYVLGTVDSIDASVATQVEYHLLWKECTQ